MSAAPSIAPAASATAPRTGRALVRRAWWRRRRSLAGFLGLLTTWQLCEALVPVLIGVVVDRGVATGDLPAFLFWAAVVVALFVVLSTGYRLGARVGMRAMETEMHALRVEIAGHALDPRGVRRDRLTGETLSLATSDAEEVGYSMRALGYAGSAFVAVVVSAVILVRIDLVLGLVVLAGVPVCLALTQVLAPAVGRRSRVQQERLAEAAGVATDLVRGLRVLHGIGGERAGVARYRRASTQARDAAVAVAGARAGMFGLAQGLSGLFLAVVTLLAGRLALDGEISVGELIAIVGLAQFLAEPIGILTELSAQLASAVASGQRIADFLATPLAQGDQPARPDDVEPDPAGPSGQAGPAGLAVRGLGHGSLDGLDLASPPGELLGVVATDPADALALVAVLAGEVPLADLDGEVRLDGRPLGAHDLAARRARLVVAPHRPDLFEGTVRSNVDPWTRVSDDALAAVLEASAADEVVGLRPGGLDEPVAPDGTTYSGGQRQRLAVARALASDAPALVLHDPTTAVDSVTERRIAQGLRRLRGTGAHTTWVVASSPALLEQTDRVVLLEGGRVRATGRHRDLLADPAYQAAVLR